MPHPYADPHYAEAFRGLGEAVLVPPWRTSILRRPIPHHAVSGGSAHDAMGLYPLTALAAEADLAGGLAWLRDAGDVSVVLVPDPLTAPPPDALARAFAICRPFKTHYVIDRSAGPVQPSKHHRYEIRRAQRACRVEIVPLAAWLTDWQRLYAQLAERHAIGGVAGFSPDYFRALAGWDALTAFAAFADDRPVAMALWVQRGPIAYYHLAAADEDGYRLGAAYALLAAAIEHFAAAALLHLGAGAGRDDDADAGLSRFKRGFANRTVTAHLCGAVLDADRYAALAGARDAAAFFPAYRA
jgi:hypothetical protein